MDQESHGAHPNDDDEEVRGGGPHPGEQSLVTRRDILPKKSLYTSNQTLYCNPIPRLNSRQIIIFITKYAPCLSGCAPGERNERVQGAGVLDHGVAPVQSGVIRHARLGIGLKLGIQQYTR